MDIDDFTEAVFLPALSAEESIVRIEPSALRYDSWDVQTGDGSTFLISIERAS